MTPIIKFSHNYDKIPDSKTETYLLEVLKSNTEELHDSFIDYDTAYGLSNYELYSGDVLILILQSIISVAAGEVKELWTTIRRYTPDKEEYYRGIRGKEVKIVIETDKEFHLRAWKERMCIKTHNCGNKCSTCPYDRFGEKHDI